jgi:serine/threonine protein kinase
MAAVLTRATRGKDGRPGPQGGTVCPDENTLAAMIQGFLEPEQLQELEAHLDGCPACLQVVADTAPMLEGAPEELARIGRYEILHELGCGAQGVVYAAFDPDLQRQVAIKIVRSDQQREARLLASLSHAHVMPVYEIGPWPGGVYMVTELVRGGTLRHWASTPRPWKEVVVVWLGAGRGLAAAHRAGLVHRDVKPDNVLLHEDGRALLTDFGLASVSLQHERVAGTPIYLAPELAQGAPADARSDQFAFCVGLFEALHGTRPFPGSTLQELHEHARLRRFGPRRRGVPARVSVVVERGLSADPHARFPSMEVLLQELEGTLRPRVAPAVIATLALLGLGVTLIGLALRSSAPEPALPSPPPSVLPTSAQQVLLAPCDALAREVQPMLAPCPASPTCQDAQLRRVLELAQCYEIRSSCEGFHRWLGVLQELQPGAPVLQWRTGSLACPPEDPHERLTHFLRFGPFVMWQGPERCLQAGATARELLPVASPEQQDQLWKLQLDVIRLMMYDHRLPEPARQEARLAERAFDRTVDWQALSRQ